MYQLPLTAFRPLEVVLECPCPFLRRHGSGCETLDPGLKLGDPALCRSDLFLPRRQGLLDPGQSLQLHLLSRQVLTQLGQALELRRLSVELLRLFLHRFMKFLQSLDGNPSL